MKKGKFEPGDYKLRVGKSKAGLGLYAEEEIPKGKCIIEYVGRTVSKEESETSRSKYLFEINKHKTIDGKPRSNKAGYINHSCRPNCEVEIYKQRVFIFSRRKIKSGEELNYDYGKEYWTTHCQPCRCEKCTSKDKGAKKSAKKKSTARVAGK